MKYKSFIYCFLCFFLCFFSKVEKGFAQKIQISGRVVNLKTGTPIPYVNVFVIGYSNGTMTNLSGEFSFNIGKYTEDDTLCITMLGYKPYKSVFKNINVNAEIYVPLAPTVYNIKEVQIRPRKTDAYHIIKSAIDSLKSNTPQYAYISDGYYREYIKENNNYARAIEAAISVYNEGVTDLGDHFFPIKVNGVRTSEDYLSKFAKAGSFNQLSLFLTNNFDYKWFFSTLEETKYEVDSMIVMDKNLVYVISGVPDNIKNKTYRWTELNVNFETGRIERVKKKYTAMVKRNTDYYYSYQFYIKSDDYAIIKMSFKDTLYKPIINDFFKHNGLNISINSTSKYIEFFKYSGKWFPRYIKATNDLGYYKKKDSAIFINISKYSDFMVNNIITTDLVQFYPEEQPRLFKDLYAQGFKYCPEFWSNYNFIPDDEMRNEVTKSIYIIKNEYIAEKNYNLDHLAEIKDTVKVSSSIVQTINEDLVFRIQIMAVKVDMPLTDPSFRGLKNISQYYHKGMYKYTWGETHQMQEAMELLKQIQAAGFPGAFVVPFYKNERITMDEAVEIYNKNL